MNLEQTQHYRALINTIDFFSQRLHVDQIVTYGYKIFEDLTLPEQGAIFTLNEDEDLYVPRVTYGYPGDLPNIVTSEAHHAFASKNGFLLDKLEVQERYFDREFLITHDIDMILPLILDDSLFGFIIAKEGKDTNGIKNREFLNRFCDLLNLALEKAVSYDCTLKMKQEIDKRIFNLNSYSQTMKLLMTALDQNFIVDLCLDVVRELTASAVTSIAVERKQNQLDLVAYKDVLQGKACFLSLELRQDAQASEVIYHVKRDREKLETIFRSCKPLEKLKAVYVVFIERERIIGCITIGESVSGATYDYQLLEQIRNLVSMMYIALDNAKQFTALTIERNKMSTQLSALNHLNRSIAIINGADSLEELCSHVVDTLHYGFGLKEGYIWIDTLENQCFKQIGCQHAHLSVEEMDWLRQQNNMQVRYDGACDLPLTCDEANCLVYLPILKRDYNETCMGHLVIDQTDKPIDEGLCMILEALTNSISPVVKQFLEIEMYQRTHEKRPGALLEDLFNKYVRESEFYGIPYYLYLRRTNYLDLFSTYEYEEVEEGDRLQIGPFDLIFSNDFMELTGYEIVKVKDFKGLQEYLRRLSMS
jgi:hypothetical protein